MSMKHRVLRPVAAAVLETLAVLALIASSATSAAELASAVIR
jgi:hypothetical protein